MCLAIGDGLTDRGFELESVSDAVTDFLYEDAVTAQLVAGIEKLILGGVVDVVAVDNKFQGVSRMGEGAGKAELLIIGFILAAIVEDVEFRRGNVDEARAVDEFSKESSWRL